MVKGLVAATLLLAWGPVAHAQVCTEQATIGHFDISFEGATFDGSDTEFEYCVTGLDDPALSHWDVTLAEECITEGDLSGCGPEPCFFQVDDPTTGITGIKWDDVEVDPGETECFTFKLTGDWTNQIADVLIGLKAGPNSHAGDICGPVCVSCQASVAVDPAAGTYSFYVEHRRPPSVDTRIRYTLTHENGRRVKRWKSEAFTIHYGDVYEFDGAFPLRRSLKPGTYNLKVELRGMSRWKVRETSFVVE